MLTRIAWPNIKLGDYIPYTKIAPVLVAGYGSLNFLSQFYTFYVVNTPFFPPNLGKICPNQYLGQLNTVKGRKRWQLIQKSLCKKQVSSATARNALSPAIKITPFSQKLKSWHLFFLSSFSFSQSFITSSVNLKPLTSYFA